MLPFSQPAFGRQSRCQFFRLMQFSAQPATGAFVLCRRTDNAASTSPGYHLQFPVGRYKLSDRINNQLLYFTSAFVPGRRVSNSATNTNASTLAVIATDTLCKFRKACILTKPYAENHFYNSILFHFRFFLWTEVLLSRHNKKS